MKLLRLLLTEAALKPTETIHDDHTGCSGTFPLQFFRRLRRFASVFGSLAWGAAITIVRFQFFSHFFLLLLWIGNLGLWSLNANGQMWRRRNTFMFHSFETNQQWTKFCHFLISSRAASSAKLPSPWEIEFCKIRQKLQNDLTKWKHVLSCAHGKLITGFPCVRTTDKVHKASIDRFELYNSQMQKEIYNFCSCVWKFVWHVDGEKQKRISVRTNFSQIDGNEMAWNMQTHETLLMLSPPFLKGQWTLWDWALHVCFTAVRAKDLSRSIHFFSICGNRLLILVSWCVMCLLLRYFWITAHAPKHHLWCGKFLLHCF